jgi:hypothetical protein
MAEQRIARPDGDFTAWSAQYFESVKKFWQSHGLDDTDLKPLEGGQAAWAVAFAKYVQAEAAYNAALEAKRAARAQFESAIRPVSAFIQTYFKTTDADRATIGITVKDDTARRAVPPGTSPQVSIKLGERLKHTLRIVDEATPLKLAKPHGVRGCEVWMKLVDYSQALPGRDGAAPDSPADADELIDPFLSDPSTFTYQGLATRVHHDTEFPLEARGKSAVYMLRWVNTRGTPGCVMRSDILRLEILARFGGVYLDTDVKPVRPLDEMCPPEVRAWAACEQLDIVTNAAMGFPPNHPAMWHAVAMVEESFFERRYVGDQAGPGLIARVVTQYDDVALYPPAYFHPTVGESKSIPDAAMFLKAAHLFAGTWVEAAWQRHRTIWHANRRT